MKTKLILPFLLFFLAFTNCDTNDDENIINCTHVFVYGLDVTLIDDTTEDIITNDVEVIATDGNYQETLMNIEDLDNFFGAGERSGNYIITVTSNNYQTYTSELINVSSDVCHVITKSIEIRLTLN